MFHNVEQNTDEWLKMRIGKVTGSGLSKIMAKQPGPFGDPAKKYAVQIALQQLTDEDNSANYTNSHMDRGHEQEPIARALYEDSHFCDVTNGGFFDNGLTGCSPDGLIGSNGVIEIKCVIGTVQFDTIKRGKFDPAYKWQLVFELRETGREYVDYVSYSSDFPAGNRLYIHRIMREDFEIEFKQVDARLRQFFALVEQNKLIIESL
jgi:hypothetical protein